MQTLLQGVYQRGRFSCHNSENIVESYEKGEISVALFNRSKKDSVLPEVDKYYEGERRDRAGLAWLLALVSVAVVALVIIGVFLAGRWAYRQIADKNDDNSVTISEVEPDNSPSFDGGTSKENSDTENEESTDSNRENNETREERSRDDNRENPSDEPENEESEDDSEVAPTTTPQTGGDEELPSTGPADTTVLVAVVTLISAFAHNLVIRKRSNS